MSHAVDPVQLPAVGRRSAGFVVDFLKGVTDIAGDFIDSAICLAVIDANVRHLMADPALTRRHAGIDEMPPDDERRPVSINAISASLGLAFETTRRRVRRLEMRRLVSTLPNGVIMSREQLSTDAIRAINERNYAALKALYSQLRTEAPSLELTGEFSKPAAATPPIAQAPLRAASRATQHFVLRYLESAEPVAGDLVNATLMLFISQANTAGISYQADPAKGQIGIFMPDDLRRRMSMKALATVSGLPFETTRRRVCALIDRGVCKRDRSGVYVPAAAFLSPALVAHRKANLVALQRLFTGLARVGIRFDDT